MERRLVAALDLVDEGKALDLAREIQDEVFAYKVNWPLVLHSSPDIIRKLSNIGNVICDFKVADIPNTDRLITERVRELGAYAIITHTITGTDSLEAVKRAAGSMKVIAVISMSHPGGSEFINPVGKRLLELALEKDVYGIVVPGNDPVTIARLRKESGNLKLFAPGIGAQGGDPSGAISAGADYLIVGRSIYESPDPVSTVKGINKAIRSAVGSQ